MCNGPMEMMLADGNVIKKLAKLKARDQGLWQKIKDFINELAAKIRNVYKGLKPDSVEGRYVADMGKAVYRLQELFAEALVDASESFQASLTPGAEGAKATSAEKTTTAQENQIGAETSVAAKNATTEAATVSQKETDENSDKQKPHEKVAPMEESAAVSPKETADPAQKQVYTVEGEVTSEKSKNFSQESYDRFQELTAAEKSALGMTANAGEVYEFIQYARRAGNLVSRGASNVGQIMRHAASAMEKLGDIDLVELYHVAKYHMTEKNTTQEGGEVKYSLRDVKVPTRAELEKKEPIKVIDISSSQTKGTYADRRRQILKNAEKIIAKPYLNRDTKTLIFLTEKSYTHAFNNTGTIQLNAAEHLPELIENAVLTHAEKPTHGSDYTDGVYTFFAAARAGRIMSVKLKGKEYFYVGQNLPKNIRDYFESNPGDYASSYDTVVLEVEKIEENPSGSVRATIEDGVAPDPEEFSTIKVADLLSLVKGEYEKYIPKFSDRDTESVSNRSLLANALEGAAQTDWEKQKLTEYKGKIDLMEAQERKLRGGGSSGEVEAPGRWKLRGGGSTSRTKQQPQFCCVGQGNTLSNKRPWRTQQNKNFVAFTVCI